MVNYALLYGKTAFTLAKDIGVTPQAAQTFIDAYFAGFPRVRSFIDRTLEEARVSGVVTTMYGRRRLVPELNSRRIEMACRLTPESVAELQGHNFSKDFPKEIPCPPELFEKMKAGSKRPSLAAEWAKAVDRLAGHLQKHHAAANAEDARVFADGWLKDSAKELCEANPHLTKPAARALVANQYQKCEDLSWTMAAQSLAVSQRKARKPAAPK